MASGFYGQLQYWINAFVAGLAPGEVVEVYFTEPNGQKVHVRKIGYFDPYMIVLYGFTEAGERIAKVTHMHSVNLSLRAFHPAVPPPDEPAAKKAQIGFVGNAISFSGDQFR